MVGTKFEREHSNEIQMRYLEKKIAPLKISIPLAHSIWFFEHVELPSICT